MMVVRVIIIMVVTCCDDDGSKRSGDNGSNDDDCDEDDCGGNELTNDFVNQRLNSVISVLQKTTVKHAPIKKVPNKKNIHGKTKNIKNIRDHIKRKAYKAYNNRLNKK